MEPTDLQGFLFSVRAPMNRALFKNAAALAKALAALPVSRYKNPKGTRAILSQILRVEKRVPEQLSAEIEKCLRGIPVSESDLAEFRETIRRHNLDVRLYLDKISSKDDDSDDLWLVASDENTREHFLILSQPENADIRSCLYALLNVYIMDIAGATDIGAIRGGMGRYRRLTPRIWDSALKESFSVSIVVPSKAVALMTWEILASLAIPALPKQGNVLWGSLSGLSRGMKKALSSLVQGAKHINDIKIWITDPSNAFVCGTSLVALNPSKPSSIRVFGLINDRARRFSDEEALAWREHVYLPRFEFMKPAKQFCWKDAERFLLA